jgi:hypothetical protein
MVTKIKYVPVIVVQDNPPGNGSRINPQNRSRTMLIPIPIAMCKKIENSLLYGKIAVRNK